MRWLLYFLVFLPLFANAQIDHWESVILEGDNMKYLIPVSQPASDWNSLSFDDDSWNSGPSGFGYGDNDDNTMVSNGTVSIYLREAFYILTTSDIESIVLYMDFDDGFVAYLNGVEVGRSLVSGNPPAFDQTSDDLHEATLYQGIAPNGIPIDKNLLVDGQNILAVQVHNAGTGSSDLTAIPTLLLGINKTSTIYRPTPDWFNIPTPFNSSSLPIVVVNSNGQQIRDEPKVMAEIGIIYNGVGQPNSITDPFNEYEGFCGIEIRGESSQFFDKKSYGFEIWDATGNDLDASFLNFPPEEDFILYGPYSDKTLLNNVLAMHIATQMGQYASRTRLVELVINQDYVGIYVLMEKIKIDESRLDIAKLNPDEISGDDLTGGYIIRIDKGIYDGFSSPYRAFNSENAIFFQYFSPDQDDIVSAQKNYIRSYVTEFEQAIASSTNRNNLGNHYTEYIDLRSFVDNLILNELSKNVDAYRLSTYFHKDKDSKDGKLTAGPVWDYNLAFGNGDYCGGDITTGYEYYQCPGNSPFWWDKFLKDTLFTNALQCRWTELRSSVLSRDRLENYIDSTVAAMDQAIIRNFNRWNIMGDYVWPNPPYFANAQNHGEAIFAMKNWIRQRMTWMDQNLPGELGNCDYYENFTSVDEEDPDPVLGIEDEWEGFKIYPNPSSGNLTVISPVNIQSITIHNTLGQELYTKEVLNRKTVTLELPFSSGSYILVMKSTKGVVRKKLIINNQNTR